CARGPAVTRATRPQTSAAVRAYLDRIVTFLLRLAAVLPTALFQERQNRCRPAGGADRRQRQVFLDRGLAVGRGHARVVALRPGRELQRRVIERRPLVAHAVVGQRFQERDQRRLLGIAQ